MKNKNHDNIKYNLSTLKQKHLENLATRLLKEDEKNQKLKSKKIKGNFLKNF